MTMPGSDPRSQRTTIHSRPSGNSSSVSSNLTPTHSIPENSQELPYPASAHLSPSAPSAGISSQTSEHEHALDFATRSWDLATGGLKVLTAKRELPIRQERRTAGVVPDILATSRSYTFALMIMVCVVLMLIGGGIVFFVMLQP